MISQCPSRLANEPRVDLADACVGQKNDGRKRLCARLHLCLADTLVREVYRHHLIFDRASNDTLTAHPGQSADAML